MKMFGIFQIHTVKEASCILTFNGTCNSSQLLLIDIFNNQYSFISKLPLFFWEKYNFHNVKTIWLSTDVLEMMISMNRHTWLWKPHGPQPNMKHFRQWSKVQRRRGGLLRKSTPNGDRSMSFNDIETMLLLTTSIGGYYPSLSPLLTCPFCCLRRSEKLPSVLPYTQFFTPAQSCVCYRWLPCISLKSLLCDFCSYFLYTYVLIKRCYFS